MFKKVYLSLAFSALSMTSSAMDIDRLTAIQNTLTHIAQEKKAISLDLAKTIIFGKKAIEHMQSKLGDDYIPLREKVVIITNTIFESEELSYSINHVTDFQATCIIDNAMHFQDITYEPSDYPVNNKINNELSKAFPVLDTQTEQLFNIWYVISANICGSQLLLKKLDMKIQELNAEMDVLEAGHLMDYLRATDNLRSLQEQSKALTASNQ